MSGCHLQRLCRPDILWAIDPRALEQLLAPHATYLAARGVTLPLRDREAPLKYHALVRLVLTPDKEMPQELLEALYHIDELATPAGVEALDSAAQVQGIATHQYLDVTPAEIVLQFWLAHRPLVEHVHAELAVSRLRTFEYFQPESEQAPKLVGALEPKIRLMEAELNDTFQAKGRGRYAYIIASAEGGQLWLYIGHGGLLRREATVDEGGRASIC
jgi:hypothetical protein